jgi:hypothetical protein
MILISDVYNILLDSLRADSRGLSCEIGEFNRLIRLVSQEIFDEYIDDFETDIKNSDALSQLKVHDTPITLTPLANRYYSYGTIPTNYYRVIGKPWVLDGTTVRRVDEVTEFEDADREDDYLTKASTTFPTYRIAGVNGSNLIQIKVRPLTYTTIYLSYLKTVTVPYLDYYVNNTTYIKTFLPMSTTPQALPLGNTYRTGTVGANGVTVLSQTVDLSWDEGTLGLILAKLIGKLGGILPDSELQKTGYAEEVKLSN